MKAPPDTVPKKQIPSSCILKCVPGVQLKTTLSYRVRARRRREKSKSIITSILISLCAVFLVCIVLLYWLLPSDETITHQIISLQPIAKKEIKQKHKKEKEKVVKEQASRALKRKPSSPAVSLTKILVVKTHSEITAPVSEAEIPIIPLALGGANDSDGNWGAGNWGEGTGDGKGDGKGVGTDFFGIKLEALRILFIMDQSDSMRQEGRDRLMRRELGRSIAKLKSGQQHQFIFFSHHAWLIEDGLQITRSKKKKQLVWLNSDQKQIKRSRKSIRLNKNAGGGTEWEPAFAMAFEMNPLPDVIVFLTDGSVGQKSIEITKKYAKLAKQNKVVINTISFMGPSAVESLKKLAMDTDGSFVVVDHKGNTKLVQ